MRGEIQFESLVNVNNLASFLSVDNRLTFFTDHLAQFRILLRIQMNVCTITIRTGRDESRTISRPTQIGQTTVMDILHDAQWIGGVSIIQDDTKDKKAKRKR